MCLILRKYVSPVNVMRQPTFRLEEEYHKQGLRRVAGVDEAGAGAWAGPVVAGAAVVPLSSRLAGIRDSKLLTPAAREQLFGQFAERGVRFAVGVGTVDEINSLGIRAANLLALRRAVEALTEPPDAVIVDWYTIPGLALPQTSLAKADRLVKSVAAASIVAKVTRDRMMAEMDVRYPGYGFAGHKGYGTKTHHEALARLGPCREHRLYFRPVQELRKRVVSTPVR